MKSHNSSHFRFFVTHPGRNSDGILRYFQPSQLFTVLRILLCLAEEATNLDGDLPQQRRKDMMTALIGILENLFKFFVETLQSTAEKMKQMVGRRNYAVNKTVDSGKRRE